MSAKQHEISQETFDGVAQKLDDFAAGLPEAEGDLVRALVRLAGEQLNELAESEVSGFSANLGVQLPDPDGFRAGFDRSFGSLTGSRPLETDLNPTKPVSYGII